MVTFKLQDDNRLNLLYNLLFSKVVTINLKDDNLLIL